MNSIVKVANIQLPTGANLIIKVTNSITKTCKMTVHECGSQELFVQKCSLIMTMIMY